MAGEQEGGVRGWWLNVRSSHESYVIITHSIWFLFSGNWFRIALSLPRLWSGAMRDQMATAGGISEGNPFIQIVIILRINIINMLINIVIRAGYVMSRLLKGDEWGRKRFIWLLSLLSPGAYAAAATHPLFVCGRRGGGCARKQIANGMVVISLIAARQQTSLYYNLVFVNKSSRCAIIKKNVNHRIN